MCVYKHTEEGFKGERMLDTLWIGSYYTTTTTIHFDVYTCIYIQFKHPKQGHVTNMSFYVHVHVYMIMFVLRPLRKAKRRYTDQIPRQQYSIYVHLFMDIESECTVVCCHTVQSLQSSTYTCMYSQQHRWTHIPLPWGLSRCRNLQWGRPLPGSRWGRYASSA